MKVCIFGGAGFIGKRIVKCLLNNGHEVIALVRNPQKGTLLSQMGVVVRNGDLKNPEDIRGAMAGAQVAISVAVPPYLGHLGLRRVHAMAKEYMRNVKNVLDEARQAGKIPVILSEGTLIWGDSGNGWHDETSEFKPWGTGRIGELSTPHTMKMIEEGAPIIRIIAGLTYGAGSWFEHIIYKLMKKGWFRTYGDGQNIFSFVYVDDVAEAYRLAVEKMPIGKAFAIVDNHPVKFRDFCNCVARVMGKPPVKSMPVWIGNLISGQVMVEDLIMNCRVRNTKAKEQLGWHPTRVSYEQGIPEAVAEIERTQCQGRT
jgi:nucleoside-diphosphate-sugar epimerase